jgi:serine/threonine protein kinase
LSGSVHQELSFEGTSSGGSEAIIPALTTLVSGSKLGPYEIVGPLGAGGMGEVYRGRDTKLGRDVALKVLPEAFARDAQRLARFQRKAKASLHSIIPTSLRSMASKIPARSMLS